MTEYQVKDFSRLLGTEGFSEKLLKTHFSLYKGYVDNTNKLRRELESLVKAGQASAPAYAEMKRRLGWEYNGMKLHELYFDSLSREAAPAPKSSPLADQMKKDFESFEAWEKDFRAVGGMRGIGWAAACYDFESGALFNLWINEHNVNIPAKAEIILIMDMWEHAFLTDYGTDKPAYINAFFKAVDWSKVEERLELSRNAMTTAV